MKIDKSMYFNNISYFVMIESKKIDTDNKY